MTTTKTEKLIPKHGGYRKLKTFQLARLIYDITVRFCDCYIDSKSRTHDQMVQAARSGVQNIAEGSQASGTSKKSELKLTNVARASLEELRLDYEDFLRQRELPQWNPEHSSLKRFKANRCNSMTDIRMWLKQEHHLAKKINTDKHGRTRTNTDSQTCSVSVSERRCLSVQDSVLIANAALSLLNLCCYLLDQQLAVQENAFVQEGGFTERLYRIRKQHQQKNV